MPKRKAQVTSETISNETLEKIRRKYRGEATRKRLDQEDKEIMLQLRAEGVPIAAIARLVGINTSSAWTAFHRFDREARTATHSSADGRRKERMDESINTKSFRR